MKLITELSEDFEAKFLDEGNGNKRMYIEGIFLQGGKQNRNKRIYPTEMLSEKVEEYNNNYIQENRAYGELGHPSSPTINGDRICMRITEMKQSGNDFVGKAMITSTPMGNIVEGLLNDGGKLGVSSRGMGSLKQLKGGVNEVQNDFMISAVDVVTDPSAPDAFVDGIMEGVEWVFDEQRGWRALEATENIRKKAHNMTMRELEENRMKIFKNFLQTLKF